MRYYTGMHGPQNIKIQSIFNIQVSSTPNIEARDSSDMLGNTKQAASRYFLRESNLHGHDRQNCKFNVRCLCFTIHWRGNIGLLGRANDVRRNKYM